MKIVSLLFLLFVSLTLCAQDITGKWYGYPDLKNMRLRLEYHVEKAGGGYQVTLKIPDLSEKTYRAVNYFNCAPPKPSSICSIHTPSQPGKATLNCSSPGGFSVMRYANVLSFSMGLAYKFI